MNHNKIYLVIGLIIIIMSGVGCTENTLSDKERTSVPDPMMTITDTRKSLRGEDNTYIVKIINMSKIDYLDTFEMRGNIPISKRLYPISHDHILLEIEVQFFENMTKISSDDILKEEILNSSLIDSEGNIYSKSNMLDIYKISVDNNNSVYSVSSITAYFSVPKNGTGFKFQYRNDTVVPIPLNTTIPVVKMTSVSIKSPQDYKRLNTGTFLVRTSSTGIGKLTIKNGIDFDAIVVLVRSDMPKEAVISLYIRSKDSYTISNIPDGTYILYYSLGNDWNDQLKEFSISEGSSRFEEELKFETTNSFSTTYSATLYATVAGNARTRHVDKSEFPRI